MHRITQNLREKRFLTKTDNPIYEQYKITCAGAHCSLIIDCGIHVLSCSNCTGWVAKEMRVRLTLGEALSLPHPAEERAALCPACGCADKRPVLYLFVVALCDGCHQKVATRAQEVFVKMMIFHGAPCLQRDVRGVICALLPAVVHV
jgi:hypothetical protein